MCLLSSLLPVKSILAIKSDVKIAVGPCWNQILAVQHYTINDLGGAQAKAVLTGLDNPCAAIEGKFKWTACDLLFLKLDLVGIFGNKGSLFFNESLQSSPYSNLSNNDALISSNIFELNFLPGIDWHIHDEVTLGFALGFTHIQTKRPACYINQPLRMIFYDWITSPMLEFDVAVNPTEKTVVSASYLFSMGTLQARINSYSPSNIEYYKFKNFMINIAVLDGTYKFNDRFSAVARGTFFVAQSTKLGSVTRSIADAALYSNNSISIFRSQFLYATFGFKYDF